DSLEGHYSFAYTVSIENLSDEPVRLLERHWMISSGGSHLAEVVGPGVMGEQPLIEVGEVFEYTGSTIIQHPVGAMEGTYTFRAHSGMYFEVPIPKFDLHYPLIVH
ncbi:MAG: Co2+/Mg2+ efflux protein ApaG, partial [Bdellovibrionales bacterium]|nr:Co2+/Mg2+ efflux protein ApaG [Bdellovibrionales bacterium]